MAYYDLVWYCNAGDQSTTGYYAVAKRPQNAAVTAGQLVRQFTAPAVNSERVFVCIIAGTTANTTDATWTTTRGAKTTDGTATWMECTGIAALNSDITNTVNWTAAKAIGTPTLGTIIQRNNGASYQICTTAGTLGTAEPAFSDTAGVTTTETSATTVWTSLGVVGNFTGGQAPHARLANACATNWFAAGNTIYVGDNHAESQATAITLAPTINATTVGRILCHNHSGNYPPASSDLRTTATISTTAAANVSITSASGGLYIYGISFVAGVGASTGAFVIISSTSVYFYFDNCVFKIATTSSASQLVFSAGTSSAVVFNGCTVSFANVSQYIDVGTCIFIWQNTGLVLAGGSLIPAFLLGTSLAGRLSSIVLEALDLSQLTSAIVNSGFNMQNNTSIKDCKLNASVTVPTPIIYGQTIQLVRSDSGATAYKSARYQYEGTETTETSITRVGGAADPTGQQQSRKIVTTANSQWLRPFKAEPYAIWNPSVSSGGDPYWSNVKLLLGFEGSDGSHGAPGMTDESSAAHGTGTASVYYINTAQFKFGASSLFCTGVDGVTYTNNTDFDLGASPFTAEAWIRPTGLTTPMQVVGKWGSSSPNLGWVLYANSATLAFNISTTGSDNNVQLSGGTLVTNVWQHVCADFDGIKYRLYLNGVVVASSTTLRTVFSPSKPLGVGSNSDLALNFVGWIDEVRLTKGTARYASDSGLAVPTAAFPRSGPTSPPVTVTVCGIVVSGTLPNNDDIWMEVEYLGSSATPLGTIVNTTKANLLAANAAVASDSSTWNNSLGNGSLTTLDSTPSASVVMSNGNLTVTHGSISNATGVASTGILTTGKYYFEVTTQVSITNVNGIGCGPPFAGVFSEPSGTGLNGVACSFGSTTNVFSNTTNTGKNIGATVVGSVICTAIDLTARLVWFRINNGNWNGDATANPATGTGGVSVPAGPLVPYVRFTNGAATDAMTANFGATTFAQTPPSGFSNWNASIPFKLVATLSSPQPGLPGYIHVRPKVAKPSSTFYLDPQITLS